MAKRRKRKGKNPAGDAFKRCVRKVAAKGSAYDPRAVCAVAGRKKYGVRKFQAMAAAGKREKARRRGRKSNESKPLHTAYDYGFSEGRAERRGDAARARADHAGFLDWVKQYPKFRASLQKEHHRGHTDGKRQQNLAGRRRNPEAAAAERYEFFHGRAPQEVVEVTEHLHEHTVLSGIGKLKKLIVLAVDGETKVTLENFKGAILAQNEEGTQLFIKGGDQQVNLAAFGIRGKAPHENEVLGAGLAIAYDTTKVHLGKDGGKAVFDHEFGKRSTRLPIMTYDTRNHLIFFAGGGYDLPEVGIRG